MRIKPILLLLQRLQLKTQRVVSSWGRNGLPRKRKDPPCSMEEEKEQTTESTLCPRSLGFPNGFELTDKQDRLICTVRNFLLRSANKVDCFFTMIKKTKNQNWRRRDACGL